MYGRFQSYVNTYDPLPELIRPYTGKMIVGMLCLIGGTGLYMTIPQVLRYAINALERGEGSGSFLLLCGAGIVGITALGGFLKFLTRQTVIVSSRDVEYDLRNHMFDHLLTLPGRFYESAETGDLMNRLTNDLEAVRRMVGPGTMYLTGNVSRTMFALGGMLLISPLLTLLALGPFLVLAVLMKKINSIFHYYARRVQEERSDLTTLAQQSIRGIRLIKAFRREEDRLETFRNRSREYRSENLNRARFLGFTRGLSGISAEIGIAITLLAGGIWYMEGTFSFGDMTGFTAYQFLLASPVLRLPRILNMFQRGRSSLERLQELLGESPEPEVPTPPAKPPPKAYDISIRNLTFSYPESDEPVLNDISLEIPEGQMVGIAGRTGAGKSTFLRLLPRLNPVPDGTIFVGGTDMNRLRVADLRGMISFVPQHNFLFSEEMQENIAFPRDEWEIEEVRKAARKTRIHGDIKAFPEGYEQEIGERGVKLSGGQKQRTAKSRSLLPDTSILLMDDPFSNLDNATAGEILENLQAERDEQTWILVSHDVQLLTACDRILVLDDGRIRQDGEPEDLRETGGLFRQLYREHTRKGTHLTGGPDEKP